MEGCEQECEKGKSVKTHRGYRHFTAENKHAHGRTLAGTGLKRNYSVCRALTHSRDMLKTCVYYLDLEFEINVMSYGPCSICEPGYCLLQHEAVSGIPPKLSPVAKVKYTHKVIASLKDKSK